MSLTNWKREDPFSVNTCTLFLYVSTEEINVTQMTTIPVSGRKHCEVWRKCRDKLVENWKREEPFSVHTYMLYL